MQIFVGGTWSDVKARPFAEQGLWLGRQIASLGHDLACGPGTGIAKYVIAGYKSVCGTGKVRFYLPSPEEMRKVGEVVGDGADEIIETGLDYPMRNIFQIRASDALFVLTGGDGTLEEAIVALADYKLPVSAVKGSGTAVTALEVLAEIFPAWREDLLIAEDMSKLISHIVTRAKPVPINQGDDLIAVTN
jgi:predicted Rossmann-fold nucleotide-binding protein